LGSKELGKMPDSFEDIVMLTLYGQSRFFLYQLPINMRKSFEGLAKAVEEAFPEELFSGAYFIFLNRRRDLMKILYWDVDGLVIWYKRLEKGSFSIKNSQEKLSRKEFLMLIEGITPKHVQKRFSL
jgi:transposase